MTKNIIISLPKVRLVFPNLFEKTPIDGKFVKTEKDRRFTATFLLNKKDHIGSIEAINDATELLMKDLKIKKLSNPVMNCCDEELEKIYDGDDVGISKKNKMAYKAGHYQLQAKTVLNPVLRKIKGIDLQLTDENPFYPGCYVNAIIELAGYNNEFGKGISKYLKYVLFAKDGEKLGSSITDIDGDSYFEDGENETENNDNFNDKDLF